MVPIRWSGQFVFFMGLLLVVQGCTFGSGAPNQRGQYTNDGLINAGTTEQIPGFAPGPKAAQFVVSTDKIDNPGKSGNVVQTGGISEKWNSVTTAFRDGVGKVGDAITPNAPPRQAPDPTALSTVAKPSANLYLSTARMAEKSGRPGEAEQYYRYAFSQEPANPAVLFAFGCFKDRQGRQAEATQMFHQAAKADPKNAVIANSLGLSCAKQGLISPAIEAVRRAVQLQPNEPRYRNNLATLLIDANNPDAAFSHFAAVHGEAVAYYNLGYLMNKKGDKAYAATLFDKALRKDPTMTRAKMWLDHLGGPPQPIAGPMYPNPTNEVRLPNPTNEVRLPNPTNEVRLPNPAEEIRPSMQIGTAHTTDNLGTSVPIPPREPTIIRLPPVGEEPSITRLPRTGSNF